MMRAESGRAATSVEQEADRAMEKPRRARP